MLTNWSGLFLRNWIFFFNQSGCHIHRAKSLTNAYSTFTLLFVWRVEISTRRFNQNILSDFGFYWQLFIFLPLYPSTWLDANITSTAIHFRYSRYWRGKIHLSKIINEILRFARDCFSYNTNKSASNNAKLTFVKTYSKCLFFNVKKLELVQNKTNQLWDQKSCNSEGVYRILILIHCVSFFLFEKFW